jgi:hypothetical protein
VTGLGLSTRFACPQPVRSLRGASSRVDPPAFRVVFSAHPASGLRHDHHSPRVLGSEWVVLSHSSSLLRPDPPVSPTPAAFPGSLVIPQVFARQPGLGCPRDLPCFGSMLLPYVPSPLRREEERGTPVSPRYPWPSSTEHGVGSSAVPRHQFPSRVCSRRCSVRFRLRPAKLLVLLDGSDLENPPAAEDLYTRACPRPVTQTPSRVSLHSPPGEEL